MKRIRDTHQRSGKNRSVKPHRRSGQAMVEMALCLLVLIPILVGIMEFGWLMKNINQLNNAAREGARAAAVGRTTTDIKVRIGNMAKPLLAVTATGTVNKGSIVLTVSPSADTNSANGAAYPNTLGDNASAPPSNNALGSDLIKVTVNANNPSLTGMLPYIKNKPIQGTSVMRREF